MKKEWQARRLCDIATIGAGNSAPQDKRLFERGEHPFFRTSDVGRVHFGDICESADYLNDAGTKGLRKFPAGTILFPKSGASTFLNHRVITAVDGYVSSHLATIVVNTNVSMSRYVLYYLSIIRAQDMVQDHAYPSLNLPIIGQIPIPLPPLSEQRRIVGILDGAFAAIAAARANTEKNLQNARALFESHLNTVFSQKGDGWVESELSLVTSKIGSGATPRGGERAYKAKGVPLIRSLNVYDDGFRFEKLAYLDDMQAALLSNVLVKKGDVLLNITGASVARCCVAPADLLPARVNQHVSIIRPIANRLDSTFLHYLLISPPCKSRLLATGEEGGSTRQAITKGQLLEFRIMHPETLAGQLEIVASLDALSAETRRLEDLYTRKLEGLTALKQSLLHAAFSGEL